MRQNGRFDQVKHISILVGEIFLVYIREAFFVIRDWRNIQRIKKKFFRDVIGVRNEWNRHPFTDELNVGLYFAVRRRAVPVKLFKGTRDAHPKEGGE